MRVYRRFGDKITNTAAPEQFHSTHIHRVASSSQSPCVYQSLSHHHRTHRNQVWCSEVGNEEKNEQLRRYTSVLAADIYSLTANGNSKHLSIVVKSSTVSCCQSSQGGIKFLTIFGSLFTNCSPLLTNSISKWNIKYVEHRK